MNPGQVAGQVETDSTEQDLSPLMAAVAQRIREAQDARRSSGIEEIWQEDEDQYNGFDDLSRPGRGFDPNGQHNDRRVKGRQSTVFLPLTKPKTDAAIARVQELLLPHDDKPWRIEPTPIPEVDDAIKSADSTPMTLGDGNQASKADVAQAVLLEAKEAAEKIERKIDDWFVEGSVYAEMRKVFRDAGRLGTGVIKGPVPVSREYRKWNVGEDGVSVLQVVERIAPGSFRIDPRNFFPDPSCGECIHDGSYTVERDYLTARQLRKLAKRPGYDRAAIAQALKDGPKKAARQDTFRHDTPGDTTRESDVFEVWYYHGDVSPDELRQLWARSGVPEDRIDEIDVELMGVPAVVTMVNDRPIKGVLNPLETGDFPYDVVRWEPVDGQVWGRGIPRKMQTGQRMVNAACRRMLENAGLSAGVNMVLMKGVITPMDTAGGYEIAGMKGWFFNPKNDMGITDVRQAIQFLTIPSVQQELMNIIQFALQVIDESTNLPLIMQGQSNREGGASTETFGGMTMAMNAANAPLRVIAKQGDDDLFVPHLKRYYDYAMQDPEVPAEWKKDCTVKAKGATVLMQRELEKQGLVDLYPIVKDPESGLSMERWTKQLLRAQGFNADDIELTPEEKQQRADAAQQQPVDPAIQAAQIRAQAMVDAAKAKAELTQQVESAKADLAKLMAQIEVYKADSQRDQAAMKLAADQDITVQQVKADLAKTAIDARDKAEERALKLNPANQSGTGI